MQLTYHSDYSLRMLVYLTINSDRLVSTEEISKAYGISKNHLVRVAQTLNRHGFINLYAGRKGGIKLALIGDVVRHTEPNFHLVECFDKENNTCSIVPVCGLKSMLYQAKEAFLATLDKYTLVDAINLNDQNKLPLYFLSSVAKDE
jgi:Rrf2 family transcriptional regulator, nitric oxide-sensitive transcriptional repressor